MRAKPYQQLRDELFTPEKQMENEARAAELVREAIEIGRRQERVEEEAVRESNTRSCDPEELREDFEKFVKRFTEEGANLRCELVTGVEGMRFVAVFNWDDMG
jgi:hypothetical protein